MQLTKPRFLKLKKTKLDFKNVVQLLIKYNFILKRMMNTNKRKNMVRGRD